MQSKNNEYNDNFNDRKQKLIDSAIIMAEMNDEDLNIFCEGNSKEDQIIIIDKAIDILVYIEDYERCHKLKKLKEKI